MVRLDSSGRHNRIKISALQRNGIFPRLASLVPAAETRKQIVAHDFYVSAGKLHVVAEEERPRQNSEDAPVELGGGYTQEGIAQPVFKFPVVDDLAAHDALKRKSAFLVRFPRGNVVRVRVQVDFIQTLILKTVLAHQPHGARADAETLAIRINENVKFRFSDFRINFGKAAHRDNSARRIFKRIIRAVRIFNDSLKPCLRSLKRYGRPNVQRRVDARIVQPRNANRKIASFQPTKNQIVRRAHAALLSAAAPDADATRFSPRETRRFSCKKDAAAVPAGTPLTRTAGRPQAS